MGRLIDLSGRKFGRLTVIRRDGTNRHGSPTWKCSCECGNVTVVDGIELRRGGTKSCGCFHRDAPGLLLTRHGHATDGVQSPEYKAWADMIQRCTNPNRSGYVNYGGRGIEVCERWLSFDNFIEDMGKRPSKRHSLDRVDNDGNYEPGNCRWTTAKVQIRNQRVRKDNTSGITGVRHDRKYNKYRARIVINGKEISLGSFDTLEEAAEARKQAEYRYWGESR